MAEVNVTITKTEGTPGDPTARQTNITLSGKVDDALLQPLTIQITKLLCEEANKRPEAPKQ